MAAAMAEMVMGAAAAAAPSVQAARLQQRARTAAATPSAPVGISCMTSLPSSSFLGSPLAANRIHAVTAHRRSMARSMRQRTSVMAAAEGKNVVILNTDSGGHAVIGYYLAYQLAEGGHKVTILTVGKVDSDKMKKPPFSNFSILKDMGVSLVWGSPDQAEAVLRGKGPFQVVVDNNGKDMDSVKPYADWAKKQGAEQFCFVSSAGIYKSSDEPPHIEGDAVKATAGHAVVEDYLRRLGFKNGFASFRPQYMTGWGNNKDCEEWFFDRIVRDRPVPIPAPGVQLTNISVAPDVASIITAAVNNPTAARNVIFNAVSDRAVTLDGFARLCAKAAGKDPKAIKIVHYNPEKVGVDAKKVFPFRIVHFYAEPREAKEKLGWKPEFSLSEELASRFEHYVSIGRDKKAIDFANDDKIIRAVR